jgi:hypothetical protein
MIFVFVPVIFPANLSHNRNAFLFFLFLRRNESAFLLETRTKTKNKRTACWSQRPLAGSFYTLASSISENFLAHFIVRP